MSGLGSYTKIEVLLGLGTKLTTQLEYMAMPTIYDTGSTMMKKNLLLLKNNEALN